MNMNQNNKEVNDEWDDGYDDYDYEDNEVNASPKGNKVSHEETSSTELKLGKKEDTGHYKNNYEKHNNNYQGCNYKNKPYYNKNENHHSYNNQHQRYNKKPYDNPNKEPYSSYNYQDNRNNNNYQDKRPNQYQKVRPYNNPQQENLEKIDENISVPQFYNKSKVDNYESKNQHNSKDNESNDLFLRKLKQMRDENENSNQYTEKIESHDKHNKIHYDNRDKVENDKQSTSTIDKVKLRDEVRSYMEENKFYGANRNSNIRNYNDNKFKNYDYKDHRENRDHRDNRDYRDHIDFKDNRDFRGGRGNYNNNYQRNNYQRNEQSHGFDRFNDNNKTPYNRNKNFKPAYPMEDDYQWNQKFQEAEEFFQKEYTNNTKPSNSQNNNNYNNQYNNYDSNSNYKNDYGKDSAYSYNRNNKNNNRDYHEYY